MSKKNRNTAVRIRDCSLDAFRAIRLAIQTVRRSGTNHFDPLPVEPELFRFWECTPHLCAHMQFPSWHGWVTHYREIPATGEWIHRLFNVLKNADERVWPLITMKVQGVSIRVGWSKGTGVASCTVCEDSERGRLLARGWIDAFATSGHLEYSAEEDSVRAVDGTEVCYFHDEPGRSVLHCDVRGVEFSLLYETTVPLWLNEMDNGAKLCIAISAFHEDYERSRKIALKLASSWRISGSGRFKEGFDPFRRRPRSVPKDAELRYCLYSAGGDSDKLLAQIDVVHSTDGSFLEVQSSRGLKWMEEFLKIKGVPPYEVWEGDFSKRWRTG